MSITIEVTQQDIEFGRQGVRYSCPIALACHRKTGKMTSVDGVNCHFYEDGYLQETYVLPEHAVEFIYQFDKYGPNAVKPFFCKLLKVNYDPYIKHPYYS